MTKLVRFGSREEWEKGRIRIGGSDAAAVMGMSPHMTNIDLWKIKTGREKQKDISNLDVVRYGVAAEPLLRELFKLDYPGWEVTYAENTVYINDKYPFAHASLDGEILEKETQRKGILEIKTCDVKSSIKNSEWKNQIPQNYYIQLLHYFMVMEADFAVLKAQLKYNYASLKIDTRHYFIEREDVIEDMKILEEKERAFHEYVKKDECPPLELAI